MRCSKLASGTRARLGAPGSTTFGLRVRSRARRDDERGGRRARGPPRSAKVDHGERALAAATQPARMVSVYDGTLPSAMWGRPDSQMSWTRWHSLSKVNSQGAHHHRDGGWHETAFVHSVARARHRADRGVRR